MSPDAYRRVILEVNAGLDSFVQWPPRPETLPSVALFSAPCLTTTPATFDVGFQGDSRDAPRFFTDTDSTRQLTLTKKTPHCPFINPQLGSDLLGSEVLGFHASILPQKVRSFQLFNENQT